MTYGDEDQDFQEAYGRFKGGYWDVTVTGGSASHGYHFSHTLGGRALIETADTPFPVIGIVVLFPEGDPAKQEFTAWVQPVGNYSNVNLQPSLRNFGPLIIGSLREFGWYRDGLGGEAVVTSLEVR